MCHSFGGIVVRYMLLENQRDFADKRVGLVLIASPSYGSRYANSLDVVLNLYCHQQGIELKVAGASLQDLDDRFKDLREKKHIPHLSGVEFYEHHSIFRRGILAWTWSPFFIRKPVVEKESAGRYFGAPKAIAKVDHNSICKPENISAQVHQYLVDFVRDHDLLPWESTLTDRRDAIRTHRSPEAVGVDSPVDLPEKPTPIPFHSQVGRQDSQIQQQGGATSERFHIHKYPSGNLGNLAEGLVPRSPFPAIVLIVLIVGLVFLAYASRVSSPIFPILAVAAVAALALLTIVTVNKRQVSVHTTVERRRHALSGVTREDVRVILSSLENPLHGWRTLEGVLRETGLPEDRARAALEYLSDLLITAEDPSRGTLFTTIRRYAESEPVFNQWLAVLANRPRRNKGVIT